MRSLYRKEVDKQQALLENQLALEEFLTDLGSLDLAVYNHIKYEHTLAESIKFLTNLPDDLKGVELDPDLAITYLRPSSSVVILEGEKELDHNIEVYRNISKGASNKIKFLIGLIKKAISLKTSDIEATNKIRYKVLRLGLAGIFIGGSVLVSSGILATLVAAIVSTATVGGYKYSRMVKTKDVLEVQIESLQSKMSYLDSDDPARKDAAVMVKKLERQVESLDKKIKAIKHSISGGTDKDKSPRYY